MRPAIDPSLCPAEPAADSLDDGFSPPAADPQPAPAPPPTVPDEAALGDPSPF